MHRAGVPAGLGVLRGEHSVQPRRLYVSGPSPLAVRLTRNWAVCGALAVMVAGCSLTGSTGGCRSYTWPRVVIELSDPGAWKYQYAWRANDGLTGYAGACNGLIATSAFVCNLGIGGDAVESQVTVFVVPEQGDDVLASLDVPLNSFNTEGDGVAVLVVTTNDAGLPVLSGPHYVNACQ